MKNFLKAIFGMSDRTSAAADRVNVAMEGIATTLEGVLASMRQRLCFDDTTPAELHLPEPTGASEPEAAPTSATSNGRRKGKAAA